jgi:hypothetical protein
MLLNKTQLPQSMLPLVLIKLRTKVLIQVLIKKLLLEEDPKLEQVK